MIAMKEEGCGGRVKIVEYERQSAKRGRRWLLLLMLCVMGEVKGYLALSYWPQHVFMLMSNMLAVV